MYKCFALDLSGSERGTMAGFCESGDKILCFIKAGDFLTI
jgi:hypothetical protein